MKKYLFHTLIFLFIFLPAVNMYSQNTEKAKDSPVKLDLARLSSQLSLTPPQKAEVERILNMIYKQAEKDGQSFKDNPDALIGAAKRRMLMQDNLIGNLLSAEQKVIFREMKKVRVNRFEYTIWKEGLRLTDYQCLKLTDILKHTSSELTGLNDRMKRMSEQDKGLMVDPDRERQRYNQTGLDGRQGRHFRLSAAIETVNEYKIKGIKKILTKEQLKSLKKVKAIVDRELKLLDNNQREKKKN